jgi:hypothetical protein
MAVGTALVDVAAVVEDDPTTPFEGVEGPNALFWIAALSLFLALLWFAPLFYDTMKANQWRATEQTRILDQLIKEASKGTRGLSVEEVRQLVSAMDRSPRGASGLTSSLLALLITFLVGVALFASLLSRDADSSDIRKTIVTSLLAVLATIAGFYFGARTAQTSTEAATKPPEARHPQEGARGPQGPSGERGARGADAGGGGGGVEPDPETREDGDQRPAAPSPAPGGASASTEGAGPGGVERRAAGDGSDGDPIG